MKYDFSTVIDRRSSGANKVNKEIIKNVLNLDASDEAICMWVADMDFGCAPEIIEQMKKRLDHNIFGYTSCDDRYYDSIIHWYKTRYQCTLKKEWITYSNGTVNAIRNVIRTFTNVGDNIIIQTPVYFPFSREILDANRNVLENPLCKDESNNYTIDIIDFEEKCKQAKMFILCNPHNPTGNIWDSKIVEQMIEIARNHNVLVFCDEVHSDIIRSNKQFTSAITLENIDHVIVASAVNKTFNLAGLQGTNLLIKNGTLRNQLNTFTSKIHMTPFIIEATIVAYTKCDQWVDELKTTLDDNLTYIDTFISKYLPDVRFTIPEGTYLAWLDFTNYDLSESQIVERLCDIGNVIVEPGSMFGKAGTGFIRMNIACPKSVVIEAMERIHKALQ